MTEDITDAVKGKFRNCPFCGSSPKIVKEIVNSSALGIFNTWYVVSCDECGVKFSLESLRDLGKLWNGNKAVTKILYVEDGSVDVEELSSALPSSTKVIVVKQGAAVPIEYRVK